MGQRMMVIAAHMGDFVWRCGGSIAKYTEEGNEVLVLVLSSGIRGEANDYWAKEGANMEAGISERLSEGKRAAGELGVKNFEFWDLPDYPMPIGTELIEKLAHKMREFRPDFVVTHDVYDAYNPDHDAVREAVRKAYAAAFGAGFQDGLQVLPRRMTILGLNRIIQSFAALSPEFMWTLQHRLKKAGGHARVSVPAFHVSCIHEKG